MTQPSPIQRYLEDLRDRLAAVPDCDRILTEAEDHLVEAAAELQQTGLPATEAERSATLRFGEPQAVAERFIRQFKQGEMMYPKKNLRGVRILAAVFAFTAVTQSAGVIHAAIGETVCSGLGCCNRWSRWFLRLGFGAIEVGRGRALWFGRPSWLCGAPYSSCRDWLVGCFGSRQRCFYPAES